MRALAFGAEPSVKTQELILSADSNISSFPCFSALRPEDIEQQRYAILFNSANHFLGYLKSFTFWLGNLSWFSPLHYNDETIINFPVDAPIDIASSLQMSLLYFDKFLEDVIKSITAAYPNKHAKIKSGGLFDLATKHHKSAKDEISIIINGIKHERNFFDRYNQYIQFDGGTIDLKGFLLWQHDHATFRPRKKFSSTRVGEVFSLTATGWLLLWHFARNLETISRIWLHPNAEMKAESSFLDPSFCSAVTQLISVPLYQFDESNLFENRRIKIILPRDGSLIKPSCPGSPLRVQTH